jgi:hypothetical protein
VGSGSFFVSFDELMTADIFAIFSGSMLWLIEIFVHIPEVDR